MTIRNACAVVVLALLVGCAHEPASTTETSVRTGVHYLEIVTPDVDAQCAALAKVHGVTFGPPVAALGNARVAEAADGRIFGVRAPLAESEQPIVRTYIEVADINQAARDVEAAGGLIAYPPTKQGDTGTWAVYIMGDVQLGLWQR
ncbi:MAG: hypothetical protein AAFU65_02720 [Pseudomonadota bacterium]